MLDIPEKKYNSILLSVSLSLSGVIITGVIGYVFSGLHAKS